MYEIGMMVLMNNGIVAVVEEIDEENKSLFVYDKHGTEYEISFENPLAVDI
jgi:hypothetical protein